jgi:hypothetical protein
MIHLPSIKSKESRGIDFLIFLFLKRVGAIVMLNAIFLRRKRKVLVETGQGLNLPEHYLATSLKTIEPYGFTYSLELIDAVKTLSINDYLKLHLQLLKEIKQMVGANVHYHPMYTNFPTEVMNEDEGILYLNAIIHYLTHWLPNSETEKRVPLLDRMDLKVIGLGNQHEFSTMIRSLLELKTSISETDRADIEWVIANQDDLAPIFPKEVPLKENVAFFVATLLKYEKIQPEQVVNYFQTATDVLRLATAFSNGDISLATNTVYKKFKRVERRLLLAVLEQCPNKIEDMLRYKKRWIRLGEILHPGEYKHRYPRSKEAFDILRENVKIPTFASRLELVLEEKNVNDAVSFLKFRPGEFARRLDHLLRIAEDTNVIVESFSKVVQEVSTPVLLQVMTHFRTRHEQASLRTFFPKCNVAKMVAIENNLPELETKLCEQIAFLCENALFNRFAELPPLGKVYVDHRLNDYVVPFS